MTDYTKLIERLHEIAGVQGFPTDDLVDAADAIEALKADRNQLQRDFTYMKQQRDALQAENERLKRELEISKLDAKEWYSQADAMKAKLDELQRQEPEFFTRQQFGCEREFCEQPFTTDWTPLYAAPKALEPLTFRKIAEVTNEFAEIPSDKTIGIARAIESAHGITKGTP